MLAIGAVVVVVIVAAGVIFIIVVGAVVDTNDHFLLPPCPFSVLHPSRFHLPRTLDGTFELAAQGRQERPRTWQDTECVTEFNAASFRPAVGYGCHNLMSSRGSHTHTD